MKGRATIESLWTGATKLRLYEVVRRFRIWDWFVLPLSFLVVGWDVTTPETPIWSVALSVYWIQRINNIDQDVSREEREREHTRQRTEYDCSKLRTLQEISVKMDRIIEERDR